MRVVLLGAILAWGMLLTAPKEHPIHYLVFEGAGIRGIA